VVKVKLISVKFQDQELTELKTMSQNVGLSQSDIIRLAIKDYIKRRNINGSI